MKLRIETTLDDKIKVTIEKDDKSTFDFEGDRANFSVDYKPKEGEEDSMIMALYDRFRDKHPKKDGTPTVKEVKAK